MTETVQTTEERRTDQINLSSVAAAKVKSLLEQEGRDDLQLRISVQPGGCSGLRYQLFFDERNLDGDVVTDFDGVAVVVDRMSVPYLNGAQIDFVDTHREAGVHHRQPQRHRLVRLRRQLPLISEHDPDHRSGASMRKVVSRLVAGALACHRSVARADLRGLASNHRGGQSRCRCSALAMRWAASSTRISRLGTSRGKSS